MATKKAGGSSRNGRDSAGKRLGIKIFGKQIAKSGSIILRQKGTKFYPGYNVCLGKDFTLFAIKAGRVLYKVSHKKRHYVHVI